MILSYLIYITELRGRNLSGMWRTFPFTLVAVREWPQLLVSHYRRYNSHSYYRQVFIQRSCSI